MFYICEIDAKTADTFPFAVQDVFGSETHNPQLCYETALFFGEDNDQSRLLLVTPRISDVPATASVARWSPANELPESRWSLLVGRADAWNYFGVPHPNISF